MEDRTIQEYMNWVEKNRGLFTDASLFARMNVYQEHESSNLDTLILSPDEDITLSTGLIEAKNQYGFRELKEQLGNSYSLLLKGALNLPALAIEGDDFYHLYNSFWGINPQISELEVTRSPKEGEITYTIRNAEPVREGSGNSVKLVLGVSYAQSLLADVDPEKKQKVFNFNFEEFKHLRDGYKIISITDPAMRVNALIDSGSLSSEELRSVGRNIQRLDEKVLYTMSLQLDSEGYFERVSPQIEADRTPISGHLGGLAHVIKNIRRPTKHDLGKVCHQLQIPFSSKSAAKHTGNKTLDDPTLFD